MSPTSFDPSSAQHIDPDILRLAPGGPLRGTTRVPGDKSISHRAILFGAMASGISHVEGWLPAGDTTATLNAVRQLGITIERPAPTALIVHGGAFQPPDDPLNLVNAGTGIRLLAGIMAGQPFSSTLDGSEQLRRRPMRRITEPLERMGACVSSASGYPPLHFESAPLRGIEYALPVASAQVKSAILLAGLFAEGPTTVVESGPGRDHTERLLSAMGADLRVDGGRVTLVPGRPLRALDMTIPGDFSSAAFLIVAASILDGSAVTLEHVSLNPTRTGLVDVLAAMGADVTMEVLGEAGGDPVGRVTIRSANLRGVEVSGETVVRMIDEFPAFMIAALRAEGQTTVRDARELRVKETDRIAVMAGELRKMGAVILEAEDGFQLSGPQPLHGATLDGHDDHGSR
jgi:3-phosphoshikimate 1-carboxyvinyltransferase